MFHKGIIKRRWLEKLQYLHCYRYQSSISHLKHYITFINGTCSFWTTPIYQIYSSIIIYYIYYIRHRFRRARNSLTFPPKFRGAFSCCGVSHLALFKTRLFLWTNERSVLGTSLSHNLNHHTLPWTTSIHPYRMPQQRLFLVLDYSTIKVKIKWLARKALRENRSPCRQSTRDEFITVTLHVRSMIISHRNIIHT